MEAIQLDDALAKTSFGKFNYLLIIISGTILSTSVLETIGMSFIMPIACDLELTTQDKGILSGIVLMGFITSIYFWGFLADTIGRRKIMIPTLFLSFVFTVLSSLSTNFTVLVMLRFFCGFFLSGSSATIYAYLGEFHDLKNCPGAIMKAVVGYGIGCMSPTVLAWIIINGDWSFYIPVIGTLYKPWRLYMLMCGVPSLLCSLALLKFPESPKFLLALGRQNEAIEVIKTIYSWNTGKDKNTLMISSIIAENTTFKNTNLENSKNLLNIAKSIWTQTVPIFKAPHLQSTVISCTLQFIFYATATGMLLWFPTIINSVQEYTDLHPNDRIKICDIIKLKSRTNTTETIECSEKLDVSSFQITLIMQGSYSVGFPIIAGSMKYVGKLTVLLVISLVCGFSGFVPVFNDIPKISIYFYLILILCGFGVNVTNAATVDLYPTHFRAMAMCIFLMMGRVGSIVGTNVFGILFDVYCPAAFMVSAVSVLSCGILVFFIPNIRKVPMEKKSIKSDGITRPWYGSCNCGGLFLNRTSENSHKVAIQEPVTREIQT